MRFKRRGLRVTEEGAVKKKSKKKNTGEDRAEYERKLKGVAQKLLHPSIGIATGIVAGLSMGGPERRSYSVIGKAVNRAARLESATRKENCDLLIDNETYEIIKQEMAAADMKRADLRDLKGLGYRQAWQWSRSTVGSLHDPDTHLGGSSVKSFPIALVGALVLASCAAPQNHHLAERKNERLPTAPFSTPGAP